MQSYTDFDYVCSDHAHDANDEDFNDLLQGYGRVIDANKAAEAED